MSRNAYSGGRRAYLSYSLSIRLLPSYLSISKCSINLHLSLSFSFSLIYSPNLSFSVSFSLPLSPLISPFLPQSPPVLFSFHQFYSYLKPPPLVSLGFLNLPPVSVSHSLCFSLSLFLSSLVSPIASPSICFLLYPSHLSRFPSVST